MEKTKFICDCLTDMTCGFSAAEKIAFVDKLGPTVLKIGIGVGIGCVGVGVGYYLVKKAKKRKADEYLEGDYQGPRPVAA